MDNADSARYAKNIVQDKNAIDVLRYVRIYKSKPSGATRIQCANAAHAIDAPFSIDVDVTVLASRFFAALDVCDAPDIKRTAKSLVVKQASFRAAIPLIDNMTYPLAQPDGDVFQVDGNLTEILATIRPFFGTIKDWMKGAMIRNGNLYATDGFVLIRCDAGLDDSIVANIPEATVAELARINLPITALRVSDHSCTFKLGTDMWLRSQLIDAEWPDMDKMLNGNPSEAVPDGLRDAVKTVSTFCDGALPFIDFSAEGVSAVGATEAKIGDIDLPDARFKVDNIMNVLDIATHIDLSTAPRACAFKGGVYTGAVMGIAR